MVRLWSYRIFFERGLVGKELSLSRVRRGQSEIGPLRLTDWRAMNQVRVG